METKAAFLSITLYENEAEGGKINKFGKHLYSLLSSFSRANSVQYSLNCVNENRALIRTTWTTVRFVIVFCRFVFHFLL